MKKPGAGSFHPPPDNDDLKRILTQSSKPAFPARFETASLAHPLDPRCRNLMHIGPSNGQELFSLHSLSHSGHASAMVVV